MAEVSAADVMKLRKATGAGMMDCKVALAEANGDFARATEIIREKGKAIANKRADREATEGCVLGKVAGKKAGIIVLNCETDFVAKNQGFIDLTNKMLDVALASDAKNVEEAKALLMDGRTLGDHVIEQTGVIGEKIMLSYYEAIEAESVIAYIHPGNQLATVVGFNKPTVDTQVAKDVAMQTAAMSPVAVDKDDVPAEVVAKELEIAKEKFRMEGKPEDMLDKIAMGALSKFFKESTLLNQAFVKDSKMTVREYITSSDKGLTVTSFLRYALTD
ncbi:MAG TPA: translation elongation factor Ts [Prolixibacteraceae bacterium]|nr:translation elongation factor Ts [Prolixibacteraceae bacterium]HPS11655.1 translation elongation factor Ts [Prolixibacteraceae bacterium]